MMKSFIPDIKNNVCTVDANGITPALHCDSAEECFYYCDRLNEAEKDDRINGENKYNKVSR